MLKNIFVVVVVVVQMILQKLTDLLVIFKRIPSFYPPTIKAIALFHFPQHNGYKALSCYLNFHSPDCLSF